MPKPTSERTCDQLYAASRPEAPFQFNAEVAEVFQDMVERSVPGYASLIHGIGVLGSRFAQPETCCYDLGCSLGAGARILKARVPQNCRVIGIDSSSEMIARCLETPDSGIQYLCSDIRDVKFDTASVVVLNLTLQFLDVANRLPMLKRIADALHPEGVLILTEKIKFEEPHESCLQARYESFKKMQGYSELEISQKRAALEQTLVRDSLATHRERLHTAGFHQIHTWFQCLHFTSILAFRRNGKNS